MEDLADQQLLSDTSDDDISVKPSFRQGPYVHRNVDMRTTTDEKVQLNSKVLKHESEGEHDPQVWLNHSCHIIVFTFSGKPVYTRYGSEDHIAGFTGTLQALISKFAFSPFAQKEDRLRGISWGNLRIEFMDQSPLALVSISRHGMVPRASLRRLLSAIHSQLLFVLTSGVNMTLRSRPNFDVRSLLGGTKPMMGNLISWMNRDMLLSIEDCAVEPLPLPLETRTSIMKILQQNSPECCLLNMLLVGHRVVATAAGSDSQALVSASDVVLMINLVISSASMRSSQSWTPVCLPSLSEEAFVYAYVQYIAPDVAYVSISISPDNANFYEIANHAESVKTKLEPDLKQLSVWDAKCPLPLTAFDETDASLEKREALARVRHCAIVLNQSRQIFSSRINRGETNDHLKDTFRFYQQCVSLVESSHSQQISMTINNDLVFVWITSEFQFFLTAPRGVDVSIITYVYQWMRENEQNLFIPNLASSGAGGTRINPKSVSHW
jgi:hypothetical protein